MKKFLSLSLILFFLFSFVSFVNAQTSTPEAIYDDTSEEALLIVDDSISHSYDLDSVYTDSVEISVSSVLDILDTYEDELPISLIAYDSGTQVPLLDNEILERRTDTTRVLTTSDPDYVRYHIYGSPQFYYNVDTDNWSYISYATTTIQEAEKVGYLPFQSHKVFSLISTAYAQSQHFDSYYSCSYYNNTSYASFSLMRAANPQGCSSSALGDMYFVRSSTWQYYRPGGILIFDTSDIDNDEEVSSSSLSIVFDKSSYSNSGGLTALQRGIAVVPGYVSDTELPIVPVGTDGSLANRSSVRWASDLSYDSLNNGTYTNFVFNSVGNEGVNRSGLTYVMLRAIFDIDDVAPNQEIGLQARFPEYTGITSDPYLSVLAISTTTVSGGECDCFSYSDLSTFRSSSSDGVITEYYFPLIVPLLIALILIISLYFFVKIWKAS